jgi:hypothetical protein
MGEEDEALNVESEDAAKSIPTCLRGVVHLVTRGEPATRSMLTIFAAGSRLLGVAGASAAALTGFLGRPRPRRFAGAGTNSSAPSSLRE